MRLLFEWDDRKAKANLKKHGISFEEASTAFADGLATTIHDPEHSDDEDRFVTIGLTKRVRLAVVVFTDRGDRIGIIIARIANARERRKYEEPDPD